MHARARAALVNAWGQLHKTGGGSRWRSFSHPLIHQQAYLRDLKDFFSRSNRPPMKAGFVAHRPRRARTTREQGHARTKRNAAVLSTN